MKLITRSLAEIPNVRILGRTSSGRAPVTLFWSASGIELNFTGSELWLCLSANYATMEPWVSVELNGAWISRFPVSPRESRVCMFRGMAQGTVKHVRILKETQAMHDDPLHILQVTGLAFDSRGEFLPLPRPHYRLEFIGDSITSGEGAIGTQKEQDWASAFFSAERSYPRMVADAFDAEYRVISQSGWGILAAWDNDIRHRLPLCYEQVCGVANGQANASAGALQAHNFSAWQPDAVIINLGTNDDGAFHNAPWIDPETGNTYQLHLLPDGTPANEDVLRLEQAVMDFCSLIRRCNPGAVILWAYGMMGNFLEPYLAASIKKARTELCDENIFFLSLPETTGEALGSRGHPGFSAHIYICNEISTWLKQYWNKCGM